jgi:hypothetical protein
MNIPSNRELLGRGLIGCEALRIGAEIWDQRRRLPVKVAPHSGMHK